MAVLTYSELIRIPDFSDRLQYLKLNGNIGFETFGPSRMFNQAFYRGKEWRDFRNYIINRDFGCDLASKDHPVSKHDRIIIHHLNPITLEDIELHSNCLLDPENAVLTILGTHNFIHFGSSDSYTHPIQERSRFDTCPWKK